MNTNRRWTPTSHRRLGHKDCPRTSLRFVRQSSHAQPLSRKRARGVVGGQRRATGLATAGAALLVAVAATVARAVPADETHLPEAKPVPDVQVIPLPYHRASFRHDGRELSRYHFGPGLRRPFWFPVIGPAGRSLTRMGHPPAPHGERHHCSLWIAHKDVAGVSFWEDNADGRIVFQKVEEYLDGPESASMLSLNHWQTAAGAVLLRERRRTTVQPLDRTGWLMLIDLQLEALPGKPIVLGKTPYGIIGLQVAKQMGVTDGGGRILNSEGRINELDVRMRPARWVDYSGPVTNEIAGGLALLDHPANPGHPNGFIVRNGGWMGVCPTLTRTLTIEPGKPLRLRYGVWVHAGVPSRADVQRQWESFARAERAAMTRKK